MYFTTIKKIKTNNKTVVGTEDLVTHIKGKRKGENGLELFTGPASIAVAMETWFVYRALESQSEA